MSSNDDVANILNLDFIKDQGGGLAPPPPPQAPFLKQRPWSKVMEFRVNIQRHNQSLKYI